MSSASLVSLLAAPWYVHVHIALSLLALVLGGVILLCIKGTPVHKAMGRLWVSLMIATAAVSFFIQSYGHLSAIHILSVTTPVTVLLGIYFIRRGRVRAHQLCMGSAFLGLIVAGAFTLLPHRLLGQLFFGAL